MQPGNVTTISPFQPCNLINLGLIDYRESCEFQRQMADQVMNGRRPGTLLLAEHPHVFTLGRKAVKSDVLADKATLARLGASIVDVDRGGQATYHGPGQLVGYPILRLGQYFDGPLAYVRTLEQGMIDALAEFGIRAESQGRPTGVWVGNAKIGAIGVKVSRGVTTHGFALNVDPNLSYFDHIIPCGDPHVEVTSLSEELGQQISTDHVGTILASALARIWGWDLRGGTLK